MECTAALETSSLRSVEHGDSWVYLDENGNPYRIIVATSRRDRERAYRLAFEVYRSRGYVSATNEIIVSPFDTNPDTLTLLAEDCDGRAAGTVSLVFDGPNGLPCDEIYAEELDMLRIIERRLCEVVRLAIAEPHTRSRLMLANLFTLCAVFARRIQDATDFVIEVNPRHVAFYRRMLAFDVDGPERPCARVQGAPAVLMSVNLACQKQIIARLAGLGKNAPERSLYAYFATLEEEIALADELACRHQPMSEADAEYFGAMACV